MTEQAKETMESIEERILICRCEDITLAEIRKIIAEGFRTIDEIKRVSRAGMGPCQGRTCRLLIAQELSRFYGIPMEEVLMPTFRPPVKPVKLGSFVKSSGGVK
jgi:NAD(P)H-nitrite reductase large subunit